MLQLPGHFLTAVKSSGFGKMLTAIQAKRPMAADGSGGCCAIICFKVVLLTSLAASKWNPTALLRGVWRYSTFSCYSHSLRSRPLT